jgi:hypothetical protein
MIVFPLAARAPETRKRRELQFQRNSRASQQWYPMNTTVLQEVRPAASFAERTLVIVPTHNEEECVGRVVRRLRERGFRAIRVVDNASTDRSSEAAQRAGAEVLFHPRAGYGLACWVGGLELPPASNGFSTAARTPAMTSTRSSALPNSRPATTLFSARALIARRGEK